MTVSVTGIGEVRKHPNPFCNPSRNWIVCFQSLNIRNFLIILGFVSVCNARCNQPSSSRGPYTRGDVRPRWNLPSIASIPSSEWPPSREIICRWCLRGGQVNTKSWRERPPNSPYPESLRIPPSQISGCPEHHKMKLKAREWRVGTIFVRVTCQREPLR